MAAPERQVVVLVGDGSWLMMNSEIATSVALGLPLTVIVLNNRGFACIERLQRASGGPPFNNMLDNPVIDFAAHARSLGADAQEVNSLADLEAAISAARDAPRTTVLVIETDPAHATEAGGHWWDVPIPETSSAPAVTEARRVYDTNRDA